MTMAQAADLSDSAIRRLTDAERARLQPESPESAPVPAATTPGVPDSRPTAGTVRLGAHTEAVAERLREMLRLAA